MRQYDADGGVDVWTHNPTTSYVLAQTDPMGRTTSYALDSDGYVTQQTNPDGSTVGYQYQSAFHALVSMTKQAPRQLHHLRLRLGGHLTSTTDALGDVTAYGYNAAGLETSVTEIPDHNTTTFAYDADRRLTSTTDALHEVTGYAFDANGDPLTTTDALGRVTTTNYDVMGRLTQTTDALGGLSSATSCTSTAGLALQSTDALGHIASSVYDPYHRGLTTSSLAAVNTPVQAANLSSYDSAGQTTGVRETPTATGQLLVLR